ncbi:MAG: hypothetical protein KA715_05465 [Xanthomonadaceae bacterium]|nr:hypothetical protein [Xanthomonadaceae bacterium]
MILRAFILCVLLFNVRAYDRLMHLNLWAEDANDYARSAFELGWGSLLLPIAGYQTIIQRFIAIIGTYVPLEALAHFYFETYILCASAVIAYFVHDDFEHIITKAKNRFFIAGTLCVVAGIGECLGNLCNLHWYFSFGLGLLAMRRLDRETKPVHIIIAILFGFSAGESLMFAPLFALRAWLQRKSTTRESWKESAITIGLICIGIINIIYRDERHFKDHIILLNTFMERIYYTVMNHFLFAPLFGTHTTQYIAYYEPLFWLFSVLVITLYSRAFFKTKTAQERLIYIVPLAFLATVALSWIVRKVAFSLYARDRSYWYWHYNRYSMNMSQIALIFTLSQLTRLSGRFSQKTFNWLLAFVFIHNLYLFEIKRTGGLTWIGQLRESTVKPIPCDKPIHIKVSPEHDDYWGVDIPGKLMCEYRAKRFNL